MKKRVLFVLISILICCSAFAKEISAVFEDKDNLPDGIIFCNGYYEEINNIFLKLQNYTSDYSKIVEYDTTNSEIKNIIYSCEKGFAIRDFSNADYGFVFSVIELRYANDVKPRFSDLYYFDCNSKTLTKINELPISKNDDGDLYPCCPCINDNYIVYLHHDFDKKKSQIIAYDLKSKTSKTIVTEKFSKNTTGITFLNICNDSLIYNTFNNKNEAEIKLYDLNSKKIIKSIKALSTSSVHYAGCYDEEAKTIVLYAQSSRYGDLIYKIDSETGRNTKLVGFRDYTVIKNDQMYFDGQRILYTVQRDISGNIIDHYYAEIYHLNSYRSVQRPHTAYCFLTKEWMGTLVYDDEKGINKIHLKINSR